MTPARQRALLLAARGGTRVARWRLSRVRSLRWAVRVPTVTLAVLSVAVLSVAVAIGALEAPPAPSQRRR